MKMIQMMYIDDDNHDDDEDDETITYAVLSRNPFCRDLCAF